LGQTDTNGNPPPPKLLSVVRSKDKAELTIQWPGKIEDLDALQVMRKIGTTNDISQVVGMHRLKLVDPPHGNATNSVAKFMWFDRKKLEPGVSYTYSVLVFASGGTSMESNSLVSPP